MPRLNRDRIRDWLVDNDRTIAWLATEADIPKASLANALCPSADQLRMARVRRLSKVTGIPEVDIVVAEKTGGYEEGGRTNGGSGTSPKRPSGRAA